MTHSEALRQLAHEPGVQIRWQETLLRIAGELEAPPLMIEQPAPELPEEPVSKSKVVTSDSLKKGHK